MLYLRLIDASRVDLPQRYMEPCLLSFLGTPRHGHTQNRQYLNCTERQHTQPTVSIVSTELVGSTII